MANCCPHSYPYCSVNLSPLAVYRQLHLRWRGEIYILLGMPQALDDTLSNDAFAFFCCCANCPRSVAKDQEAHGACSGDDSQLGPQSSVRDPIGMFHDGHRRHSLYTVGNLPRRRGAEVVGSCRDFHWISSAAVADDLQLFAHCVLTAYQGNNTSLVINVIHRRSQNFVWGALFPQESWRPF